MSGATYEIQGYLVVLDKIAFITRVFQPEEQQSYQFNIRFHGDVRLAPQYPARHEAELARELLIKALKEYLSSTNKPS